MLRMHCGIVPVFTNRYHWKFAQNTLNGNGIQDMFLVVKLVVY
jgi:hypothetical protein